MTARTISLIVVLAALALGLAAFAAYQRTTDFLIAPIGPATDSVDDIDVAFCSQTDARWGKHKLGKSGYTIASSGCTLCCVAMALSSQGKVITPDELNRLLVNAGGFTDGGLIIWKNLTVHDGRTVAPVRNSHQAILDNLKARRPVIAKVALQGGIIHWVLIVGVRNGRYRVADPLDGTYSGKYLDAVSDGIYAIRELRGK